MLKGYIDRRFKKVAQVLQRQIPASKPGGAALAVYYKGECVIDAWGGTMDERGKPWGQETLSLSYSTTKGVVSTLLHILADRGLVDYDRPVALYWPEFARSGKERITVRQVMCHEAGLYNIRSMIDHARRITDWDYMIKTLEKAGPEYIPGTAHAYHGITYGWLAGEIVQRVTGKSLRDVLREELTEPLNLDGLYIGIPKEEIPRRARLVRNIIQDRKIKLSFDGRISETLLNGVHHLLRFVSSQRIDLKSTVGSLFPRGMLELDFNSQEIACACIPAVTGTFTARSLAKMYAVLAGGGELKGTRLLSEETVRKAGEEQNNSIDRAVPIRMRWRLGYHRPFALKGKIRNGFGHFGFGGSGGWADPERNLALGMVLNSGIGSPFGDLRIIRLNDALIECVDGL